MADDYQFETQTEENATILIENLVGTGLFVDNSLAYLDDGASVADVYVFTIEEFNSPAAGFIKVRITTSSPNNPYDGLLVTLPADGITVIAGFGLSGIVKDIGVLSLGHSDQITVGKGVAFGTILAGNSSGSIDMYIKNISGATLLNNQLIMVNKPQLANLVGTAVISAKPNGIANPAPALYHMAFTPFLIGDQKLSLTVDAQPPVEKAIIADGVTENTNVIDGVSIIFEAAASISITDEAQIEISDATDFINITKDVNGVPDPNWGLGPIDITQIDGIITGRIDDTERGRFWVRYIVPEVATSDRNLRQFSAIVTGQAI